MSETKHTPGPRSIEDPISDSLLIVEAGKEAYEWRSIAIVPTPDGDFTIGEPEANARLICAAPDLLSALKSVIALSDRKHKAWDAAKAAIAKAEGR